jgi:acetylornithine deacetylase/succinyl-diaminopimelate desuccinylase-like protein
MSKDNYFFGVRAVDKDGRVIPLPPAGKIDPEWRIYARSASDDRAPLAAIATALDALKASGIALHSNIKFIFEGEEEASSPHLAQIIAKYKDLLAADVWLICDGPVHQSRRPQVVFGARGITTIDITLYGPNHELHSGHYGNWAPNPAMALARLLADGQVDKAEAYLDRLQALFPERLYIELSRRHDPAEDAADHRRPAARLFEVDDVRELVCENEPEPGFGRADELDA